MVISLTTRRCCASPGFNRFPSSTMHSLFTFLLFASPSLPQIFAGTANNGEACNVANSRLQAGTYQFWSECNSVTFCNSTGLCQLKGCRKDDFPFGYTTSSDILPPKCEKGEFCPDEGSECLPQLEVGSACQLNRDGRLFISFPVSSLTPQQINVWAPTTLRILLILVVVVSTSMDPYASITCVCE